MAIWSDKEVDLLLKKYPQYAREGRPIYALTEILKDRSVSSIEHKVRDLKSKGLLDSYNDYANGNQIKKVLNVKVEEKGDNLLLESYKGDGRIRTLDALKKAANIDESLWKVDHHIINKWEVAAKNSSGQLQTEELWQVKAWLKPRKSQVVLDNFYKDVILERIASYAPKIPSQFSERKGNFVYEIAIPDVHLGKETLKDAVGDSSNVDFSLDVYSWALSELIYKGVNYVGKDNIEKIIFPVGNDFFHFDNSRKETSYKTPMAEASASTHWQGLFKKGTDLLIQSIEILRQVAPIEVIVIPGNHDEELSYCMGEVLSAWYRGVEDVFVDNAPTYRKYVHFGNVLIGYTHGNHEKKNVLPGIMAGEVPKLWGDSIFREWHVGHLHHRKVVEYDKLEEFEGVIHRVLPTLSPADYWHTKKGYVCKSKSAEAYMWDKLNGLDSIFHANQPYTGQGYFDHSYFKKLDDD